MTQQRIPIVLFVYNRPETTRKVVNALSKQTIIPKEIIVYADGSRSSQDDDAIEEVAEIISTIRWTKVTFIQRPENMGCAPNIIHGLTDVFRNNDQAVIVEDDILPSQHFYEAMCILLNEYRNNEIIFSVGSYPTVKNAIRDYPYDVIMSPRFSCWGWGTWADRWSRIEGDLEQGKLPYSTPEEVPIHAGEDLSISVLSLKNNPGFSWAYPTALHCLRNNWLQAITNYYLTNNIGLTSGEHGYAHQGLVQFYKENNVINAKIPQRFPKPIADSKVDSAIREFLSAVNQAASSSKTENVFRTVAKAVKQFIFQKKNI